MVDDSNFRIPEVQFKIAIISSLLTSWDSFTRLYILKVSKRVIRLIQRQMLHPRNSSEYSRRRMCNDCNVLGNLKNKRLSIKPVLRSLPFRVASKIAVAIVVLRTTRPMIVGSAANPSVASANSSVIKPKTATRRRRREFNGSGRPKPVEMGVRRKGLVTKRNMKRQMRGR